MWFGMGPTGDGVPALPPSPLQSANESACVVQSSRCASPSPASGPSSAVWRTHVQKHIRIRDVRGRVSAVVVRVTLKTFCRRKRAATGIAGILYIYTYMWGPVCRARSPRVTSEGDKTVVSAAVATTRDVRGPLQRFSPRAPASCTAGGSTARGEGNQ